jgi:hypothetical protein
VWSESLDCLSLTQVQEPVPSREEALLRAKVAELEHRVLEASELERQNSELKMACERLEDEVRRERQIASEASKSNLEVANNGLKSCLWLFFFFFFFFFFTDHERGLFF